MDQASVPCGRRGLGWRQTMQWVTRVMGGVCQASQKPTQGCLPPPSIHPAHAAPPAHVVGCAGAGLPGEGAQGGRREVCNTSACARRGEGRSGHDLPHASLSGLRQHCMPPHALRTAGGATAPQAWYAAHHFQSYSCFLAAAGAAAKSSAVSSSASAAPSVLLARAAPMVRGCGAPAGHGGAYHASIRCATSTIRLSGRTRCQQSGIPRLQIALNNPVATRWRPRAHAGTCILTSSSPAWSWGPLQLSGAAVPSGCQRSDQSCESGLRLEAGSKLEDRCAGSGKI